MIYLKSSPLAVVYQSLSARSILTPSLGGMGIVIRMGTRNEHYISGENVSFRRTRQCPDAFKKANYVHQYQYSIVRYLLHSLPTQRLLSGLELEVSVLHSTTKSQQIM